MRPISGIETFESLGFLERAMGIEPTSEAWEASILPLYDARSIRYFRIIPKNVTLRTDTTPLQI